MGKESLDTGNSAAVEALVQAAYLEIIPLKGAIEKLAVVPTESIITVTCSAKLGLDRTLDFSVAAAQLGYRVVPHLAARLVADEATVRRFIQRLDDAGITDLYVIGGDATDTGGPYSSAAELVEALRTFDHGITSIGVACYPEGHPSISDEKLAAALVRVQPNANYMVSQLCFNAQSITGWLDRTRASGITLPLHLGLAAPMQIRKLAELSLRIGVGSSVRYLTKQHGFIGQALKGTAYRPEKLLYELGDAVGSPAANIDHIHMNTFNQIDSTVQWQARLLSGV